jgi:hypothetical protein
VINGKALDNLSVIPYNAFVLGSGWGSPRTELAGHR